MKQTKEKLMGLVFMLAACMSIACVSLICVFLFSNGLPAMKEIGFADFLTGKTWKPGADIYGVFPMIVGSVYVTGLALAMGVPVALLTAVYLAFFCPERVYRVVKPAVELMAGIPSIVYGLFGMLMFGNALRLSYALLSGALTLAINFCFVKAAKFMVKDRG